MFRKLMIAVIAAAAFTMAPAPADARIVNNGQQFNTLIDDVGHVKAVKRGERIRIGGLGILHARKRPARKARSR